MTNSLRKQRLNFTPKQQDEYARLMVEEAYTKKQIMDISSARSSAVIRWERQYLAE